MRPCFDERTVHSVVPYSYSDVWSVLDTPFTMLCVQSYIITLISRVIFDGTLEAIMNIKILLYLFHTSLQDLITMTLSWARLRLKSPASRLFTQAFIQAQIKENIKAPRHWPLLSEFPAQRASSAENVPLWWRLHVFSFSCFVYVIRNPW